MQFSRQILSQVKKQIMNLGKVDNIKTVQQPEELGSYLSFYGFDRLMELECCRYGLGYIDTDLGSMLVHQWQNNEAIATIVVVHGLFDHVGLYLKLIEFLLLNGYSVIAFDMPGHGLSDGERVSINNYEEYANVIRSVVKEWKSRKSGPLYAIGQSNGCAALMTLLLSQPNSNVPIDKFVMLAPLVRVKMWWWVKLAYALAGKILKTVHREFSNNSHDKAFTQFIRYHDPLQFNRVSVRWVGALIQWVNQFDHFQSSDISVLVIQGDADETVDWQWNREKIESKFSNLKYVTIPGAMHHLVNEGAEWRGQCFKHIGSFLSLSK
ncbi:alpha/beta hydrolase [Teredinibacter sp. KSP-S5-2]|uniref:alpha/beta hydrolase n=1 Tax=Teredinibacter sp. KSP-S5-2 TaxID=3034506 RepID=UPI002934CAC6|nr:alpha/beta hydrolase [Teredinibacter sp. KSP-S5-2]WNO08913.1 alpha/beta hydrolase [Teredinibacter sp. KSP-S5-2]